MISVIGTGTMGKGIAIELARFNYKVQLITVTRKSAIDSIKLEIERIIDKFQYLNKDEIMSSLTITNDILLMSNSDLIIEAVSENYEIKRELLSKIKSLIKPDAVLASNTSSLSINELFSGIHNSNKVLGLHFFNPVQVMKLVEIVYTEDTSGETLQYAKDIVTSLDKEFVAVKDSPGFVVNRLLIPMINEASRIIDEGVATAEDIDKAMRLGANHPIGPLKLSDLIGNDVTLSILEILKSSIGESIEISRGLSTLVEENKLGRKSKIGYYDYSNK